MRNGPPFLSAPDEKEDELSVAALRMLLLRGEVLSLRWHEVRLDGDVCCWDTKNGRSRTVHLNARAKEVLEELNERRGLEARTRESEYVFPSRRGTRKGHLFDLRKPFEKTCREAGI